MWSDSMWEVEWWWSLSVGEAAIFHCLRLAMRSQFFGLKDNCTLHLYHDHAVDNASQATSSRSLLLYHDLRRRIGHCFER